ncbi:MAG TPA: ABC transporter substrate-binding protein [Clostridia bacterium]|nr:ABC transporter substrate-binding protein [Clostridia bacterium]
MKRFVSVLLIALLVAMLFAGCAGDTLTPENSDPGTSDPVATQTPSGGIQDQTSEEAAQAGASTEAGGLIQSPVTEADFAAYDAIDPGLYSYDPASATNDYDGDIVIVQADDMVTFDTTVTTLLHNADIQYEIYSRLFVATPENAYVPELCESYELVSDTEWRFTIHKGVKFHDGSVLTIDDVVYSLNRAKDSAMMKNLYAPVVAITKVDDDTISITTNGPYPGLTAALGHAASSILSQEYAEWCIANDDWTKPIGTGRYKFDSREIGNYVKLVRFDDYFNQDDPARNASLTIKVIPEATARTIAVETGEAHVNVDFSTADYDRVLADGKLKIWARAGGTPHGLGMDVTVGWFTNKLVRQAVSYAIDREACLEVGYDGLGVVSYTPLAPHCIGYVNNPLDMYSYDVEKAKQLMTEAGCTGFSTQLIVISAIDEKVAVVIQSNLAEIGINVEIVRIEPSVFTTTVLEHGAPLYINNWGCFRDPDMFLGRRFGTVGLGAANRNWYATEELDAMIVEARSTFDEEERAVLYKAIQEYLAVDMPEAELYVPNLFMLTSKEVKGAVINHDRPYRYYSLHF